MSDKVEISSEDSDKLKSVGYSFQEKDRSGSFLLQDSQIKEIKSLSNKIELLTIKDAAKRYSWVEEKIETTPKKSLGYFMRIKENVDIKNPIQTGFYMKKNRKQATHNLVIAEQGSSINLISGCTANVQRGKHIGITYFEVKKGAEINLAKMHHWPSSHKSVSQNNVILGKNGKFNSHYIALTPFRDERVIDSARLEEGASANFNSLVYAEKNSEFNIEGNISLKGKNSRSQVVSKSLSTGGTSITDETICGKAEGTRGHIECDGLLLNEDGKIKAIPRLEAEHPQTDLSHEAAIGKISQEELNYMMARGLSIEKAKSLIIQGFLNIEDHKLPKALEDRIEMVVERIAGEGTT